MKNILIVVDTSRGSGRTFLAGVERYGTAFADWQVILMPPNYLTGQDSAAALDIGVDAIDGVIIRDAYDSLQIQNINKPKVINDTRREWIAGCSTIVTDSRAIGNMAADYLFGLGFRHFGYCGFAEMAWSHKRLAGFKEALSEKGVSYLADYQGGLSGQIQSIAERRKLSDWLSRLPRPACVFACNDDCAVYVLLACQAAGLHVPEEVAVLGVDNDELVCNLSRSALSSIELDFEQAGFQAARHLDELMGGTVENTVIPVRPRHVVQRGSTDILAVSDAEVAAALIYIRRHFAEPIQVSDVVAATTLSRRELEKRFQRLLKTTIRNEIERLRIDLIKKKLSCSSRSICQIASELAFIDREHFSRYFKRAAGQTPLAFRRQV